MCPDLMGTNFIIRESSFTAHSCAAEGLLAATLVSWPISLLSTVNWFRYIQWIKISFHTSLHHRQKAASALATPKSQVCGQEQKGKQSAIICDVEIRACV